MYDLITIGSATRDVFLMSKVLHPHRAPDALTHIEACFPFGAKINVDEIHFSTGGGSTNTAVTFARLGKFKTAAIARIGQDRAGQDILDELKKDKIDRQFIQKTKKECTAYSTILSPGGEVGERTILVYRGASEHFDHKKIPWPDLKTKWFYSSSLGGDIALLKKLISHTKKINAEIAFNPGIKELELFRKTPSLSRLLAHSLSFLILNREEAAILTGKPIFDTNGILASLLTFAPIAVMTDGSKGAYAIKCQMLNVKCQGYYIPSVGHNPKNLTGAGDAFGSGFITGWIKSRGNIEEALRVGAINADSVVQQVGAKIGILNRYPSSREIKRLPIKTIKM